MRIQVIWAMFLLGGPASWAWGIRGHQSINRAAVRAIPADGPAFLKAYEDWISYWAILPDSWRYPSEPALRIVEDPNHGWFKEQFSFLKAIPRSRYEFVLALYGEYRRVSARDPEAAKLINVRWTGTLPYAAEENYERMKTAMRRYRTLESDNPDRKMAEMEIASYMGRLGHYTGDGAMPLHDSIQHDGWVGANPKGYTRDPRIHGKFESAFVDLIRVGPEDLASRIAKPRRLDDPFVAILAHLDKASTHVEEVYELDKSGALDDAKNQHARELVYGQLASGAELLRDLAYTAWIESGQPVSRGGSSIDPNNPLYNPATGSAPPGRPVKR